MFNDKTNHQNEKADEVELREFKSPDIVNAANTGAKEIAEIELVRTNRHSGSAGGDQNLSIEIDMGDGSTASRLTGTTELNRKGTQNTNSDQQTLQISIGKHRYNPSELLAEKPLQKQKDVATDSTNAKADKPHDYANVDDGTNMVAGKPESWRLPTKGNYKGWIPGDWINPLNYDKDTSLYIQQIMKQNFVIGSDGKRTSIFDLTDIEFKYRFGNAARHAIGTGDLIFNHNIDPAATQTIEFYHEPQSWLSGAIEAVIEDTWKPYQDNLIDSGTDMLNNAYAAKKSSKFHKFEDFARQMLNDAWESAIKGSGVLGIPQGLE